MTIRDRHIRRTGEDYLAAFLSLFPQGLAWPRNSDSVFVKLIDGLSQVFGYVDDRAADLLEIESDPRKTTELLLDWERNWGLPDQCIPNPSVVEDVRRLLLVEKMTLLGAQSRAFFKSRATSLGETITINEYSPYQCGISRVGDTRDLRYSDDGDYRWGLCDPIERFRWTVTLTNVLSGVECITNRYHPAHSEVVFKYSSTLERAVSTYYLLGF